MRSTKVTRASYKGLALVELATTLAVLGLLGWAVSAAYGNTAPMADRAQAMQTGLQLQQLLRAFALNNARLPCPDLTGGGWEGDASGACPAGSEVGWLPYRALGLELPADAYHATYAVFRDSATPKGNADLAVRFERTGDSANSVNYQDVRDLMAGLIWVQSEANLASHTRITGDGGSNGAIDCNANVSSAAYWIALPLNDQDSNGERFDSVQRPGFSCAYVPGTATTPGWDDVVTAESPASLAAWLGARTR